MAMTMTISNNSSAKRITVQIPTSSGDAIEAWVYSRNVTGGTHAHRRPQGLGLGAISPRPAFPTSDANSQNCEGRGKRRLAKAPQKTRPPTEAASYFICL